MRATLTRIALILLTCLGSLQSFSQTVYLPVGIPTGTYRFPGAVLVDSMFILPVRANATWNWPNIPIRKNGEVYVSSADSLPYFHNGIVSRRPAFFKDTSLYLSTQYQNAFNWKLYGNTFPFPGAVTLGTSDDRSLTFLVNSTNVGAWTNQDLGALLVGTTTYDGGSAAKLQVNGTIKGTFPDYSSGGNRYLVQNFATSNIEKVRTLPLVDTRVNIRTVSDANTNVGATDYIVMYTTLTAPRTVTLPLANTMTNQIVIIKDGVGNSDTNAITITRSGSNLIDGGTTTEVNGKWASKSLFSDGTNWWTIN